MEGKISDPLSMLPEKTPLHRCQVGVFGSEKTLRTFDTHQGTYSISCGSADVFGISIILEVLDRLNTIMLFDIPNLLVQHKHR